MQRIDNIPKQLIPIGLIGILWLACSSKVLSPEGTVDPQPDASGGGSTSSGGQTSNPPPTITIDFDAAGFTNMDADTVPTEDANCGLVPFVLDRSPSPVVLAQDRSTSMRAYLPGGVFVTRWEGVRTAIKDVVAKTEFNVAWGLQFFPNNNECQVSAQPEVPTKLGNAKTIIALLDSIKGNAEGEGLTDGTPTNKILDSAVRYLQTFPATRNKYIVLATDGQPTCLNDNSNTDNIEASLAAAKKATEAGIKIAVVGIAFNHEPGKPIRESMAFLNAVADMGGMARTDPLDPDTHYYPANNPAQLTESFKAIAAQVISCTFSLPKVPPVKDNVVVKFNGVKLSRSTTEGWEYDSDTQLTLHGSTCNTIKNTEGKTDISIIMGCPGQIIY